MKLKLDKTYHYEGQDYGPGEADVPEELGKFLKGRLGKARKAKASKAPAKKSASKKAARKARK